MVFYEPLYLFTQFHVPILSEKWVLVIQLAQQAACLLAALGLFTRPSTIVSFALTAYCAGLPNNFGSVYHYDAVMVLVMLVFGLARAGDAWSMDSLIRSARGGGLRPSSGEYTWPIRMATLILSLILFSAGYSKLSISGIRWALSDNLSNLLLLHCWLPVSNEPLLPGLGLAIASSPTISRMLALGALLTELLYPLALVSRRARFILIPSTVFLFLGIRLTMGPTFWPLIVCQVFWVPWHKVLVNTGRKLQRSAAAKDSAGLAVDISIHLREPVIPPNSKQEA